MGRIEDFDAFRSRMNERILSQGNQTIKRFFSVDALTYHPGALDTKTKEMLGLATSLVLRCDDCVTYHILECRKHGVTHDELFDIFSVALTIGGSIVVPHLRRAVAMLEEAEEGEKTQKV